MNIQGSGIIATDKRILNAAGRLLQVAALVYRNPGSSPEILLITSRGTGRWIIPKGWPKAGKTLHDMALREAFEESGIRGTVDPDPIGQFDYMKYDLPPEAIPSFTVNVYAVEFKRMAKTWPERGQRISEWVSPDEAADRVAEPELKHLLMNLPVQIYQK
ncbi:NUDIX hydrolase [Pseudochrobactrum sp. MP213Fo]|uniref:NUDIX hydrolase n=1 Tax=Pseudochrobactrum sp. MP213Fo TaxID=3022250 RepID=UPI003B9DC8FA